MRLTHGEDLLFCACLSILILDHAGNLMTRQSRTGFLQMANTAVLNWHSKIQCWIEGATLGSEFVAAKVAMEANRALRYKLQTMGVPIDSPTYMLCDNMLVVQNISAPESMLMKKINSTTYHAVRESVAMGELLIGYIKSEENIDDVMTKVLLNGEKQDFLVQAMLWDLS
jgi:hypothetical protein